MDWSWLAFTFGAVAGALVAALALRGRHAALAERARQLAVERERLEALDRENEQLKIQLAAMRAQHQAEAERNRWLEQAEIKLREAFQALAASALQNNTTQFLQHSREQIEKLLAQVKGDWNLQREELRGLVEPLEKTLHALDVQVRELEQKREGAYQGLVQQLTHLSRAQQDLQTTALQLEQALRGSSRVRGRWGELQLRRIAELAGMQQHVDFAEQASGDAAGRPDMIVHLPNGGVLPVDAKVPMQAYLEALESTHEAQVAAKLAEHAQALRTHIQGLARREYWKQFEQAPEFVVLVVPYESGLAAAFQQDPQLLEYALDHRVLVASPVTLFALLKAVAYGWLQWSVSENARDIVREGQELYRRLGIFVEHFACVGQSLDRTLRAYNEAVGSLESRLRPVVRRLSEMGTGTEPLAPVAPVETQPRPLSRDPADDEA